MTTRSVSAGEFFAAPFQRAGRAHFSSAELESERHAAAERLGELIGRREELLSELSQADAEMQTCEKTIRSFE